MDITDLEIIKILLRNSRTPYRIIGQNLGLTVNAIHKRVQKMCEMGVIRKYTATPNLAHLQGKHVLIAGTSKAKSLVKINERFRDQTSIFFIGVSGAKHLHIDCELQKNQEINEFVEYVKEKAEIEDPFVGIIQSEKIDTPEIFTNNEKLILKALQKDGHKSSIEIADEIELSSKTISKSIKKFQDKKMVDFSINWAPDSEKDLIGNFEIYLNKEQNPNDEIYRLLDLYPNIVYFQVFSNVRNIIMITTWFDTSKKMQAFFQELESQEFDEVILRIIYNGFFFETWRTRFIENL